MPRLVMHTTPRRARAAGTALAAAAVLAAAGCADKLLGAKTPDIIPADAVDQTAATALALRNGVEVRFQQAMSGSNGSNDNVFFFGGLLADEWRSSDTFEQRNTVDARNVIQENSFLAPQFRSLTRVRSQGTSAIAAMRGAATPIAAASVGEVFAWEALTLNLMAESFCNGTPLSALDAAGNEVFGERLTNDSVFAIAANLADSAAANVASAVPTTAAPNPAPNAAVVNLAAVVKGRSLLNRGQYAAAAAAVAGVPTTFRYWVRHSLQSQDNQMWALNVNVTRYSVSDGEGVNGLPFGSAKDPRLPVNAPAGRLGFDSFTPWIGQTKWGRTDSVMVASGIEARLIQAEAALNGGPGNFLTFLNDPRTQANGGVAGLTPLTDPGGANAGARLNLVMRERAFWMFSTGHRLGDLRRLIRQYGRNSETVFPTGTFPKGGTYGTAVNLPVSIDEANNPKTLDPAGKFQGCLDRAP